MVCIMYTNAALSDTAARHFSPYGLCRTLISTAVLVLSIVGMVSSRGHGGGHGGGGGGGSSSDVKLCSEVHSRCFSREGCKTALNYYFLHCIDLSESDTFHCSEQCKMALIMLLSSDEHDGPNAFRDCDCEGEDFCLKQKQRIAVCTEDVQASLDAIKNPNIPVSCSLAGFVCSADTPCLAAIDFYQHHCKKLHDNHNPRCTAQCNNSLAILYRQTKANKLHDCYCDGTETYNCTALKDNTQRLCFGIEPHPPEVTTVRIRHPSDHDHTRCPHGVQTPQSDDDVNNVDNDGSIEKDVQPVGASSHNSAYTIHSGASPPLCLNYKQSLHTTIIILTTIYICLMNR